MIECLRHLNLKDEIPGEEGRQYLSNKHPELWWATKQGRVIESERKKGTLSRPLANVENWMLHLEDSQNAQRLLDLGTPRQSYFVHVSIWLADLMLMRVVRYSGYDFNQIYGQTETVPWERSR